jgi:uncharacterized membrane protein YadS
LIVVLGIITRIASIFVPINHLLLAVAIGFILANTIGVPSVARPGVERYDILLETGIVLMGLY